MSVPRYAKYKDSGVEWLGKVPAHWEVKRLKQACHVFPSNVDKKCHDGETPVVLCNYTDVYYNERITPAIEFMPATASSDQIAKFTLRSGDTIITKDSETADDIAVAAYVPKDLPGVVCGYHLSIVRPMPHICGAFVKRIFDSVYAKSCFASLANGLTRFGLGQYELDNVVLAFPPLPEQSMIAEFLDRGTAKMDALVKEQRLLIELLKEKRQAVISHAVTKGLNPHAPIKSSGIEWLGDVPEHWQCGPLRRFWEVVDCKHITVPFLDEGFPVASVMEVRTFELDLSQVLRTSEEFYKLLTSGGRQPIRGDIIYCRNTANTGTSAYVGTDEPIAMGQDVSLIKSGPHNGRYLNYILHGDSMKQQLETIMVGSTFKRINVADIKALIVVCPPRKEQDAIVDFIESNVVKFDALTAEVQRATDLLRERRTALISAAVTGKIDVRALAESEAA